LSLRRKKEEDAAVLAHSHTDWTICFSLFFSSSFFSYKRALPFFYRAQKKKKFSFLCVTTINLMCVCVYDENDREKD
jgi:hypothetical protein